MEESPCSAAQRRRCGELVHAVHTQIASLDIDRGHDCHVVSLIVWCAIPACLPLVVLAQPEARKPNIVLFLVDDMGWQDTSVPFHAEVTELNRRYRTPHMEQLAQVGMKFTQAYACSV